MGKFSGFQQSCEEQPLSREKPPLFTCSQCHLKQHWTPVYSISTFETSSEISFSTHNLWNGCLPRRVSAAAAPRRAPPWRSFHRYVLDRRHFYREQR